MYKRVVKFLDKYSILSENQYGFRKKRSTNRAIMELVTKISKAIEYKEYTMGVFLDLSKAFDTVNHNILLYKLEHFGNKRIVLEWFKNCLSNRKQIVNRLKRLDDEIWSTTRLCFRAFFVFDLC